MSRLADAAHQWLSQNAATEKVRSRDLWQGMRAAFPELTASTENRKTPYNTLMRDMRLDPQKRFVVGGGFVALTGEPIS